jgi:hypothetical protein
MKDRFFKLKQGDVPHASITCGNREKQKVRPCASCFTVIDKGKAYKYSGMIGGEKDGLALQQGDGSV